MKQIYNKIIQSQKILFVSHQNPDADTLGSASAMMSFCDDLQKPHFGFCSTNIHPQFNFLPNIEKISNDPKIWLTEKVDIIIVLDAGDTKYAGITHIENDPNRPFIINIDHHRTNTNYGDLNLVIPNASSTAEIIYQFLTKNKVNITNRIATALLSGIVTDTERFLNSATTTSSLVAGGELINRGANLKKIENNLLKNESLSSLKIWGVLFSRLERDDKNGLVYTYLTQADLKKYNLKEEDIESVANFMNSIVEARIGMFLKETTDKSVKASLRTTDDLVDVAVIAKTFGGGGHKKAAGFLSNDTIEKTIENMLNLLNKLNTK